MLRQRGDQFRRDHDDQFGFGFVVTLATEGKADQRKFTEKWNLVDHGRFSRRKQPGDHQCLTEAHFYLRVDSASRQARNDRTLYGHGIREVPVAHFRLKFQTHRVVV